MRCPIRSVGMGVGGGGGVLVGNEETNSMVAVGVEVLAGVRLGVGCAFVGGGIGVGLTQPITAARRSTMVMKNLDNLVIFTPRFISLPEMIIQWVRMT